MQNIHMLRFVLINSIILNLLCVWIWCRTAAQVWTCAHKTAHTNIHAYQSHTESTIIMTLWRCAFSGVLCTLYMYSDAMWVTIGDSGLCCCVNVTSITCQLNPFVSRPDSSGYYIMHCACQWHVIYQFYIRLLHNVLCLPVTQYLPILYQVTLQCIVLATDSLFTNSVSGYFTTYCAYQWHINYLLIIYNLATLSRG